MFLRDAELNFPIRMSAETFGGYNETVVDSELTALTTTTSVAYSCEYTQIKDFLNYIFTYSDKMTIPSISMKYHPESGRISGSFAISEFAFINDEDPVKTAFIPSIDHGGNEAIFANVLTVVENPEEIEEELEEESETETEDTEQTEE